MDVQQVFVLMPGRRVFDILVFFTLDRDLM